jgi:hypothetical protein
MGMYGDYDKVMRVIDSCETTYHLDAAKKMRLLFRRMYCDIMSPQCSSALLLSDEMAKAIGAKE